MLTKVLGCAVIIICAAKIGFDEAARYSERVREIREFQTALISLKGEISFCRTPLSEALIKTGKRLKTAVADIFIRAGEGVKSGKMTALQAWDEAISDSKKKLTLKDDEMYIITSFGKLLGASDAVGQLENIELTSSKLVMCENLALEDERKHAKLYRSLGIIGGMFLAILFL